MRDPVAGKEKIPPQGDARDRSAVGQTPQTALVVVTHDGGGQTPQTAVVKPRSSQIQC